MVTSLAGGMAVSATEKSDTPTSTHKSDRQEACNDCRRPQLLTKIIEALRYGFYDMVRSIGGWLVGGLLIAALITEFVPTDFFASLAEYPLLAMLAVVAIAVPMYVCATGSIPIALSLMLKGLSPGTALVLLMAGPAANFASVTLLSRELGKKAAAIYIASIIVGAVIFGLAADYLMPRSWFPLPLASSAGSCHSAVESAGIFSLICACLLAVLLIVAFISRFISPHNHNHSNLNNMSKQYQIKGMNCPHCQQSVQKAISSVAGVESVTVNLSTGIATVDGNPEDNAVYEAISSAGFDPVRPQ